MIPWGAAPRRMGAARRAILAIPRGQAEAGHAIGLTRWQVLRDIVLPQMIRHAIPGFTNNWLVLLKATALVSIIGLDDMVHRASLASAATREPSAVLLLRLSLAVPPLLAPTAPAFEALWSP